MSFITVTQNGTERKINVDHILWYESHTRTFETIIVLNLLQPDGDPWSITVEENMQTIDRMIP